MTSGTASDKSKIKKLSIKSCSTKHETMSDKSKGTLKCQNVNDDVGIASITRLWSDKQNICVIDQVCLVKMAHGWILAKFFFAFLWTSTSSQSIKTQKRTRPVSSHLDQTSLVDKGFIIWPKHYANKISLLRDQRGQSRAGKIGPSCPLAEPPI